MRQARELVAQLHCGQMMAPAILRIGYCRKINPKTPDVALAIPAHIPLYLVTPYLS